MENDNIKFELIDLNNYSQAAECLAYMFFNFEPVTSSLGLEWNSYSKMMNRFCWVIGTNGVCFLARETFNDKVVGVITSVDLMIDFRKEFAKEIENFDDVLKKMAPDMAMTAELAEPLHAKKDYVHGECIHLFQCGILPEYSGMGIAAKLVNLTIETAKNRGYKQAAVSCTSENSKKIFDKLGFDVVNSIKYSDFEFKGEKFFKNIPGEYILLIKKIS